MAEHLASIFGTEKDRVNCPFYFKIGACRHGDRCGRLHNRPSSSVTLLFSNMYQAPDATLAQTGGVDAEGNIQQMDPKKLQEHFEDFYEDIFEELSKYGEVENLNVCSNLADHMIGNVYVKFAEEEQASAALHAMTGRFYSGRPIMVEFSPVTDFREATCRQFEENNCNRGGYCNFMHLRKISRDLRRKLFGHKRRSRSRSYSPYGRGEARGGTGGDGGGGSGGGRGGGRRRDYGPDYGDRRGGGYGGGRGGGRHGGGYGGGYEGGEFRGNGGGGGGRGGGRPDRENRYSGDRGDYDSRPAGGGRGGGGGGYRRDRSRSLSPGRGGGGSGYGGSRGRSPVGGREGSAERRAKIEQWNREKEGREAAASASAAPPRNPRGGGDDGPPGRY